MKGFIEKAVFMARAPIKRGAPHTVLRNKVGVAVCSTRRSGGIQTLQSMMSLFAHTQMIMPCGGEWPIASFGAMDSDAFLRDKKGLSHQTRCPYAYYRFCRRGVAGRRISSFCTARF